MLIDAGQYFGAVREALLNARSTVFIVGWDLDSRTRLVCESGKAEDGLPENLIELLTTLVKERPKLVVNLLAIATVRLVPIAPFTFVNLAAGASKIPFPDYLFGTILGLVPGLFLMSALGHQIISIITEPTPTNVSLALLAVLAWIAVSLLAQALVVQLRSAKA